VLSLSHLEALVATCKYGSYTHAAEALFISQPALHHKVKALEGQLGIQLLVVRDRRVVPTAMGESFVEAAESLLLHAQQVEQEFLSLAARDALHIGAFSLLSVGPLSHAVEAFARKNPDARVSVDAIDADGMYPALLAGRVELVVTYLNYVTGDVEYESLSQSRVICAAAPGHPLVDGKLHEPSELLHYPLALTHKGMALRSRTENWFAAAGIPEVPVSLEARTGAILALQVATMPNWITFLPETACAAFRLSEIRVNAEPLPSEPVVCYLSGRPLRKIAFRFLETLRETFAGQNGANGTAI
jgi:DNA-binding transcriptional LysR family regulator